MTAVAPVKRKVSVTLDADIVAALSDDPGGLSAAVNAAARQLVEARQRQEALGQLLAWLEQQVGPLGSETDEREIARLQRLLGGDPG